MRRLCKYVSTNVPSARSEAAQNLKGTLCMPGLIQIYCVRTNRSWCAVDLEKTAIELTTTRGR